MIGVDNLFKQQIKEYGRQSAIRISFDNIVLDASKVISVNKRFNGDLFRSIMQMVECEIKFDDMQGRDITIQYGFANRDGEHSYINLGTYVVDNESIERNVETGTVKFVAYDYLITSHREYDFSSITYPITVKEYLQLVCERLGYSLGTETFINADKMIYEEKYAMIPGFTFRDVLDEIAGVTASVIHMRGNVLYVKYPTETGIEINENGTKSLSISNKWGPINSVVLAREPQEDNVYKEDEESINRDGITEIRIANNQIMDKNLSEFMDGIFSQINGIYFYPFELDCFGYCYFEPFDIVTLVDLDGIRHQTVILNDTINITSGLSETMYLEMPEVAVTDYTKALSIEKRIRDVQLYVDKQNGEIKAEIQNTNNKVEAAETTLKSLNTSLAIEQGKIEQIIKDTTVIINGEDKTTKEAYSYMKQQIDSIQFAISESGGNNKLLNSAGWNSTNFWEINSITSKVNLLKNSVGLYQLKNWYDIKEVMVINVEESISGSGFEFTDNGTLYQDVKVEVGEEYVLSYLIKVPEILTPPAYYEGLGIQIINTDDKQLIISKENNLECDWTHDVLEFVASSENITILMYQMAMGSSKISDIILTKKADYQPNTWGPHNSEVSTKTNDIKSYTNTDIRNNTVSGYAFELVSKSMQQSFKTIIGNSYNVSCKIKKYTNTCYFKILNGEEELYLFNLNNEYVDNWIPFNISFVANDTQATIQVGSESEYLLISDIMVNDGEIPQQWSSSNDEIYTSNVKIDKTGITISQDETANKTVINTVEFAGYEKSKKVFSLNGDTTEVNRLIAESDVTIGVVKAYAKTNNIKKGLGFAYIKK